MGIYKDLILASPKKEYRITQPMVDSDFQKLMNQWRHEYHFVILSHRWTEGKSFSAPLHSALIVRVRKDETVGPLTELIESEIMLQGGVKEIIKEQFYHNEK